MQTGDFEQKLQTLLVQGFERVQATNALKAAGLDINKAVAYLVSVRVQFPDPE